MSSLRSIQLAKGHSAKHRGNAFYAIGVESSVERERAVRKCQSRLKGIQSPEMKERSIDRQWVDISQVRESGRQDFDAVEG